MGKTCQVVCAPFAPFAAGSWALGWRQSLRTVGYYGTQPGSAAACFTQVAIWASSSSSPSRMSR